MCNLDKTTANSTLPVAGAVVENLELLLQSAADQFEEAVLGISQVVHESVEELRSLSVVSAVSVDEIRCLLEAVDDLVHQASRVVDVIEKGVCEPPV